MNALIDSGRGRVGSLRSTAWVIAEAGMDEIGFFLSSSNQLKIRKAYAMKGKESLENLIEDESFGFSKRDGKQRSCYSSVDLDSHSCSTPHIEGLFEAG